MLTYFFHVSCDMIYISPYRQFGGWVGRPRCPILKFGVDISYLIFWPPPECTIILAVSLKIFKDTFRHR